MRHYAELEPVHRAIERGASVEARWILHREEDQIFHDHTACDLQCGDSLAIAVGRIGERSFGMDRLRRSLTRGVGIVSALTCLVPPGSSLLGRSKERA
jgi:hypothetical protein